METLLALLALAALVMFCVGMAKPSAGLFWMNNPNRWKATGIYLTGFIVFSMIGGALYAPDEGMAVSNTFPEKDTVQEGKEATPKQVVNEAPQTWEDWSLEKREEFIEDYIDDNEVTIITNIESGLEQRVNYPETMEIKNKYSFVQQYYIKNLNEGTVMVPGKGTAKNAFGVPIRFDFLATLYITKDIQMLGNLQIQER